jgi:RNA polymerase sigma-70 factor (ECF subfamily)
MTEDHRAAASDEDLLRAFLATADQDAITELLRRHESRVYGLAYRLLGNRPDALDATQEVFITVFRKARSFRFRSAFSTWLYRLTINATHDLRRKAARTPIPTEDLAPEISDPIEMSTERMAVSDGLRQLPTDQREAVVMRDLIGASYEEIAEATGVPVGTVKSRIARGRLHLASLLGEPTADRTRLTSERKNDPTRRS